LALVEPSEPCWIETEGDDEELLEEEEELVGAGAGAGADGCDADADGVAEAAGVTDAVAGVAEAAEAAWWTAGFFAATWCFLDTRCFTAAL
jgi:hypothetical protein